MIAPFFIVASARSGTTFLRLTLNAHPDVAVPPESRFITELWPASTSAGTTSAGTTPAASLRIQRENFLARLAEHKRFKTWGLSIEAVANEIGDQTELAYAQAIRSTYVAYAKHQGKSSWGDKTPRYIENIPLLAELFPDARFIHIVRDGRNVALSYAHVDFGPRTVAKAAQLWGRRVSAGIREGRALGPERYIEIRNEDLASDTEAEVNKVCSFLGIEADPAMFDEKARARGVVEKSKHNFDPAAGGRKHMSDWRTEMKPRDIEVVEAVAGDVLTQLGYERRYPEPSASARLKAKLALLGLPLGRIK
jgi:hypothetical protein